MITPFERVRTQDQELRQVQEAAASVFKDLTGRAVLDGVLVSDVVLAASTPKVVSHNLGRKLVGWILVRKNAEADVWDSQATNRTPTTTLVLEASAAVTISLWVF